MFELQRRPHEFLLELALEYGPIFSLLFPLEKFVLVSDPAAIEYMLHYNYANYLKQTGRWRAFQVLVGNGLLTLDGAEWRCQRQRIQPAFQQERLIHAGQIVAEEVERVFARWRTLAAEGRPVNVYREMLRLSMLILARAMFGRNIDTVADAALGAFRSIHVYMNPVSFVNLLDPPNVVRRILAPGFREFERAFGLLDRLVQQIVSERLANPVDTGDLVSALILGRDEDAGHTMNASQLRDEVITAFQAGHEPMAIGLTWACYLLSKYPATRVELQAEARQILGGRSASIQDLPHLKLNRMVVEETLRLLPPAWGIDRKAAQGDELGGYAIPAGTIVGISSYVVHRLPAYWKNPEGFDPLRFTPENSAGRPTYAYLPFGGGPRRCIGFRFAMTQMQMILAALVQNFDLDLIPGPPVVPRPRLNLIPSRDFLMTVRPVSEHAMT